MKGKSRAKEVKRRTNSKTKKKDVKIRCFSLRVVFTVCEMPCERYYKMILQTRGCRFPRLQHSQNLFLCEHEENMEDELVDGEKKDGSKKGNDIGNGIDSDKQDEAIGRQKEDESEEDNDNDNDSGNGG